MKNKILIGLCSLLLSCGIGLAQQSGGGGSGGGGGGGTVTQINCNSGLSGGIITTSGTCSLDLTHVNAWTAMQSFTDGDFSLLGSGSGSSVLHAPATGGGSITFPAGSGTLGFSPAGGIGNALFGTVSGNVSGDVVTLSNTGVGVQDSGTALSALALLNNPTFTGTINGAAETLTGNLTLSGLNATGTVSGSWCSTSAGLFVYKVGANCEAGSGGVTSFSGDGALLSNSSSTGAVTSTLANAGADTVWGNATGSSAAPGYTSSPNVQALGLVTGGSAPADGFITASNILKLYSNSTLGLQLDASGNILVGTGAGVKIADSSGDGFNVNETISGNLTFGGVTTSAVIGTGSIVLSASPTLTGTLNAAAGSFSGLLNETGTTTPTVSPGTLSISGIASAPTFTANGEAAIYSSASNGIILQSDGSVNAFILAGLTGSTVFNVTTAGAGVFQNNVTGTRITVNGSTISTNGIYLPSANTLGLSAGSTEFFSGTTTESITLLPFRLKNYTVGTLPSGTQGDSAFVTDAVACTFLATPTGGSSTVCPVFYNGTAWVGG